MKITMTLEEYNQAMIGAAFKGARAALTAPENTLQSEIFRSGGESPDWSKEMFSLIWDAGHEKARDTLGYEMLGGDDDDEDTAGQGS